MSCIYDRSPNPDEIKEDQNIAEDRSREELITSAQVEMSVLKGELDEGGKNPKIRIDVGPINGAKSSSANPFAEVFRNSPEYQAVLQDVEAGAIK